MSEPRRFRQTFKVDTIIRMIIALIIHIDYQYYTLKYPLLWYYYHLLVEANNL